MSKKIEFDQEFKDAISHLTSKEKDKLLFRLIKKDRILAHQLHFELVSVDTVQERRAEMVLLVTKMIAKSVTKFRYASDLLIELRSISAKITEHVKITRDKYGEASLNLLMLNEALSKNKNELNRSIPKNAYTFNLYVLVRTFKILILIKGLHEDFFIEFEDGLKQLSLNFNDNLNLKKFATSHKFDITWLLDIPDNIAEIQKEIRSHGFLK